MRQIRYVEEVPRSYAWSYRRLSIALKFGNPLRRQPFVIVCTYVYDHEGD